MTAEVIVRKLTTVYMKNYITVMQAIFILACVVGMEASMLIFEMYSDNL